MVNPAAQYILRCPTITHASRLVTFEATLEADMENAMSVASAACVQF